MSNFDPNKLGGNGGGNKSQSKPFAERLFVAVESYETPSDGFHYAVGRRIDSPDEMVKVRLNTVKERLADWPGENEAKVTSQYVTGEFHRDSIADKAKAKVPLISFDEAYRVGVDDKGVAEYRAHWPKVMAVSPQAEAQVGLAHIKLRDASEDNGKRINAQAYVEVLKGSVVVNKDNVDEALGKALSTKDEEGRARDPLAIVRVFHDGKQVAAPRLYPERESTKVFDQTLGDHKEVFRKADADVTLGKLFSADPAPGFNQLNTDHKDLIRAVVAGVKGDEAPKFATQDKDAGERALNFYYGAKTGALTIEVVAAEKIDFGPDSRKTYLNDKNRAHLSAYTLREPNGDFVRETPVFTNTAVAVQRHPDGEPFAVFASPTEMYPVTSKRTAMTKLADIPVDALPPLELSAKAAKTVEAPPKPAPKPEQEATADAGSEYDGPGM
jgi:hypothetical protein